MRRMRPGVAHITRSPQGSAKLMRSESSPAPTRPCYRCALFGRLKYGVTDIGVPPVVAAVGVVTQWRQPRKSLQAMRRMQTDSTGQISKESILDIQNSLEAAQSRWKQEHRVACPARGRSVSPGSCASHAASGPFDCRGSSGDVPAATAVQETSALQPESETSGRSPSCSRSSSPTLRFHSLSVTLPRSGCGAEWLPEARSPRRAGKPAREGGEEEVQEGGRNRGGDRYHLLARDYPPPLPVNILDTPGAVHCFFHG